MATNEPQTVEQLGDAIAGMSLAMSAAIRALIRTHPNQEAFVHALEQELQKALSEAAEGPTPARTLLSMRRFWKRIYPIS